MVPEIKFRDEQAQSSTPRASRGNCLRRLILWSCSLVVLLSVVYLFRAPLCRASARAWIVNDPLDKADAIVILGGGLDTRPIEAARLYHLGLAPRILIMKDKPRPTASLGLTPTETELTRQVLLKKDVPESAIITIGNPETGVANTHDESLALRDWLARRQEDRRKDPAVEKEDSRTQKGDDRKEKEERRMDGAKTETSSRPPNSIPSPGLPRRSEAKAGAEGQGEGDPPSLLPSPFSVLPSQDGPLVSGPVVSSPSSVSLSPNSNLLSSSRDGPLASAPTSDLRPLTSSPLSVIIVTDLFHSRRANWLFRKQLKPLGAHVAVDATPVLEYTAADWWQHENGVVAFQNELLKYVYYRIKY